eukprot:1157368-Pelagomonas_calceolata.AAC.2
MRQSLKKRREDKRRQEKTRERGKQGREEKMERRERREGSRGWREEKEEKRREGNRGECHLDTMYVYLWRCMREHPSMNPDEAKFRGKVQRREKGIPLTMCKHACAWTALPATKHRQCSCWSDFAALRREKKQEFATPLSWLNT